MNDKSDTKRSWSKWAGLISLVLAFLWIGFAPSKPTRSSDGLIFLGLLILSGIFFSRVLERVQWSWGKVVGAGCLALAVVFFFSPLADAAEPYGVFVFVGLLLLGLALVSGILGTPHHVTVMRHTPTTTEGRHLVPVGIITASRSFCYPVSRAATIFTAFMGLAFLAGGIAFGILTWNIPWKGGHAPSLLVSTFPLFLTGFFCATGLGFLWYIARWTKVSIHVTPSGLTAQTLAGHVAMPWTDVLALKEVRFQTGLMGEHSLFQVYSSQQKLDFQDTLAGTAELRALIAAATGLEWE